MVLAQQQGALFMETGDGETSQSSNWSMLWIVLRHPFKSLEAAFKSFMEIIGF